MWAKSTSGLLFRCGVALDQHLNPRTYAILTNPAGTELIPKAGSLRLCKAPHCPVLSPYWVRVELLTCLFTSCIPLSLAFQGPLCGSGVSGEKPPGPSSGSGKEKPPLSWAGCQLLLGPA